MEFYGFNGSFIELIMVNIMLNLDKWRNIFFYFWGKEAIGSFCEHDRLPETLLLPPTFADMDKKGCL